MTGAILAFVTGVYIGLLWSFTPLSVWVWWQAGVLLVVGYLLAAVSLLGINQFVKLTHREYQRLSP